MIRPEKLQEIQEAIDYFKVVEDKIIDEPPSYINVRVHEFTLNCGLEVRREEVIKGKGNNSRASVIIPVTEDGTVILTIQSKPFIDRTVGLDFAGGLVDKEEDFETAAHRELREETGLSCSRGLIRLGSYYTEDTLGPSFNTGFLALDCKRGEQKLDSGEFIRLVEVTVDELFELGEMGYIKGGGSQFLLLSAKPYIYEFLKRKSNVDYSEIIDDDVYSGIKLRWDIF